MFFSDEGDEEREERRRKRRERKERERAERVANGEEEDPEDERRRRRRAKSKSRSTRGDPDSMSHRMSKLNLNENEDNNSLDVSLTLFDPILPTFDLNMTLKSLFSLRSVVKRDEKNVAKRNDDPDREIRNHEIKMYQQMILRLSSKVISAF